MNCPTIWLAMLIPKAVVAPAPGASMVVKVYSASWAATRELMKILRDSTTGSSARCMEGPPAVYAIRSAHTGAAGRTYLSERRKSRTIDTCGGYSLLGLVAVSLLWVLGEVTEV